MTRGLAANGGLVLFTSSLDVFHRVGGRDAAERIARERRGKAFDPEVVDAFLATARDDAFWAGLEHERIWDQVLALEPATSPYQHVPVSRLDDVALAFADYAGHEGAAASRALAAGR